MIRRILTVGAALGACGLIGAASAVAADATAAEQLASLSWLAGSWYGPHEKGHWEVCYTTPEGGVILSANKEIIGDRVVTTELEHFAVVDGKVVLTPHPNGRRSKAQFTMTEYDEKARRAVFANPEHDFPREIIYHRVAEDNLVIHVSGKQGGRAMTLKLDLKRREPK